MSVPMYNFDAAGHLVIVCQLLGVMTTEKLSEYVVQCRQEVDRAESLGPILDPTAYREALHDGSLQDAKNQLAIVEALLKARELIDKREAFVASMEAKKAARKKP